MVRAPQASVRWTETFEYRNRKSLFDWKVNLINLEMFPVIKTLQTLWCNNNEIEDLVQFMNNVCKKFENLRYLSMMRNPACPSLMNISGRIYLSIYLSGFLLINLYATDISFPVIVLLFLTSFIRCLLPISFMYLHTQSQI